MLNYKFVKWATYRRKGAWRLIIASVNATFITMSNACSINDFMTFCVSSVSVLVVLLRTILSFTCFHLFICIYYFLHHALFSSQFDFYFPCTVSPGHYQYPRRREYLKLIASTRPRIKQTNCKIVKLQNSMLKVRKARGHCPFHYFTFLVSRISRFLLLILLLIPFPVVDLVMIPFPVVDLDIVNHINGLCP